MVKLEYLGRVMCKVKDKRKVLIPSVAVLLALILLASGISIGMEKGKNVEVLGINTGLPEIALTVGTTDAASTPDYTCDGVADDVQIQAAIDALPATGGRINILTGTYAWTAGTTVTRAIDNVTIVGTGRSTVLNCDGVTALFTSGGNNWVFRDFSTDAGSLDTGATTGWTKENILEGATYVAHQVSGSILPTQDSTYNIGALGNEIADIYADRVHVAGPSLHIGASTILSETGGTNLDINVPIDIGGKLTAGANEIEGSNFDIDGGTVDSITLLTASNDLDIGAHELRAETFESDVATGTAPFTIASTTTTTNLSSDLSDGYQAVRTATLVVAANNASAASKAQADYICDSTEDEVQINSAITTLPAGGGRVVLSEGTFVLSAPIAVNKNHTALVGYEGTTLDVDFSGGAFNYMIVVSADNIEITNITFAPTYIAVENPMHGISGSTVVKTSDVTIHNCSFLGTSLSHHTTISKGIGGNYAWDWRVHDNFFLGCSWEGISFGSGIGASANYPKGCIITNNTVLGTGFSGADGSYGGIVVEGGALGCIIANNIIRDITRTEGDGYGILVGAGVGARSDRSNLVQGNIIENIQLYGITTYGVENSIKDNVVLSASTGIQVNGISCDRITVERNTISRCAIGVGVANGSVHTLVKSNIIEGCGYGIDISGDDTAIEGNTIRYISNYSVYYRAGASAGIVRDNTIINYGTSGANQTGVVGLTDTQVLRNIFYDDQVNDIATLNGAAASGQKNITVNDATVFAVNEAIMTYPTGFAAENHIIASIDYYTNVITTTVNLTNNHSNADPVTGRATSKYAIYTAERAENNYIDWTSLVFTTNYISDVSTVINNTGVPSTWDIKDTLVAVLSQTGVETRMLLPCVEQAGMTVADYSHAAANFAPSLDLSGWPTRYKYVGGATYYTIDADNRHLTRNDDPNFSFGNGAADSGCSFFALVNLIDATDSTIIAKRQTTANREWEFYLDSNDYLTIETWDDSVPASIGCEYQTALTEEDWLFVVGTYDGSSAATGFKLYIDGIQVADVDITVGAYVAMEDLGREITIGVTSSWINHLDGSFSWVGVVGKELDASEVKVIYQAISRMIER